MCVSVICVELGQVFMKNENWAVAPVMAPAGSSLARSTNSAWPVQEASASVIGGTSPEDRRLATNTKVPRLGGCTDGVGSLIATSGPERDVGAVAVASGPPHMRSPS